MTSFCSGLRPSTDAMADIGFNRARFQQICYAVCAEDHSRFNIGTYKEKKLHLVLKRYFEPLDSCHEIPHTGYIADIQNAEGIIEIQTSGFAHMKGKLEAFLPASRVTVVYPVAEKKWVTWIDPVTGDIQPRHRSPKKGKPLDAIPEMIFIKDFLTNPNLSVCVPVIELEEYRLLDGKRSLSRKRGSSRYERMPLDIYRMYEFRTKKDYIRELPFDAGDAFTAKELAQKAGFRGRRISAAIRVLTTVGAIRLDGKQGRANLYRVCEIEGDMSCHSDENRI